MADFKYREIVSDAYGNLYEVRKALADKVWARPLQSCPAKCVPLDAADLYRADAGLIPQYPRELREGCSYGCC